MTRIILESENKNDVILIKELAERLNISYKIQSLHLDKSSNKDIDQHYKIINKVVDVSNYGDASQWQRNVREDRDTKPS